MYFDNVRYDIINHMLLKNKPSEFQMQYSFLVHSSIYPMVQKYLTRSGIQILQQLGSYELKIGAYTFNMEMLILGSQSSITDYNIFIKLIESSQFTYFWDEKVKLFHEVESNTHQLEKFIAINDLDKHVISVEMVSGENSVGVPIKVVTFDSTIQRGQLLNDFQQFLINNRSRGTPYLKIYHYYFTNALPWHQPEMFLIYSIPSPNQRIFLGLQTFLTCMRELSYTREPHLDLIGLCSLKLAFCNDRNLTEASCDLGYEIDALIERFLRRMRQNQTYINSYCFALYGYAMDKNSLFSTSYPAIPYLAYTYQHIFDYTNLPKLTGYETIQSYEFTDILNLVNENILQLLRRRSNISHVVDGKYYENMNSRLFCELLKCNVKQLRLNTNYKWTNAPNLIDFGGNDSSKLVTINLMGTNQFNFIEDFVQFLKTIPVSLTSKMILVIYEVTFNSYHIFKKLTIEELIFFDSMVTFTMLTELSDGLVKTLKINFKACAFEDRTCTWSVLINGFNRKFVKLGASEGENMWQHLFESIANHLTKFKLNEFRFECDLLIRCQNHKTINFRNIKFMFDEFNTQLEMRGLDDQIIDFYYLKNFGVHNETTDDYKNFEFYQ